MEPHNLQMPDVQTGDHQQQNEHIGPFAGGHTTAEQHKSCCPPSCGSHHHHSVRKKPVDAVANN